MSVGVFVCVEEWGDPLISCIFFPSAQVNVVGRAAVVITTLCAVWLLVLSGAAAKGSAKAKISVKVRPGSTGHQSQIRAHH